MTFNYDYFGLAEPARFYLCKTDNTIICELNGIDLQSVSYTKQLNNFDTIQFDVHRYVNCEESNGYDMLDEAMYIFVDGIGYFRMSYPEVSNDGFDEYKSVSAQSCECELALKTLKNFKINTGETDSYEYLAPGNVEETDEGVKIAKKSITLYDQYNPELSLLHLALSKVSGWKIGIVDQTVAITTIEEPTVNEDGSVTTKTVTSASKRTFDIDSKSVYAFLTQDVSKKFECIFEFDIIKREINVRDVDTYGKDSNVFISYRNLIQELNYSPAQENNILTRFDVRGADDLTIDAVNFGTSTIEDLSYYLNTKHHVSDDLVDHYNKWLKAIEEARKKYMYYNRQYNILMEKRDEVNNRVPNDGLNNNWKQFTVEELGTIKKKYTGYMNALKDKDLGYWDATNKKWLNKGAEQDYIAYQGILEIIDQTIKYKQASVTETEKEENNLDDLLEEWNTNWDLFGLAELKTKEKTYKQNIEALAAYAKAWEDLGEDEQGHLTKANYDISHNQYVKYVGYESGCSKAIDERQKEYDGYQSQMTAISKNMADVAKVNDKKSYGFSDAELNTLNKLYNDTAAKANSVPWSGVTGKPSSYPPSSHTHSYLPLSGGTVTGIITSSASGAVDIGFKATNSETGKSVALIVGSGKLNRGVYDYNGKKWMIYADSNNNIIVNGSVNGNASTASKLSKTCTISLTGSVTGSGSFDGSGNLSISTSTNHTHSSVNDSGDGGATTFAYSKSGMNYSDYSWLAGWNGKELRAVSKSQFATAGHTHNYAGSSSAGGSANSAVKLTTARSISIGGFSSGSASFDGSANITIDNWGYGCKKYVTTNSTSAPYFRIAYCDDKSNYSDRSMIFVIDSGYNGGGFGIVKVAFRNNDISKEGQSGCELKWLVRQGFSANQLFIKGNAPAGESQYADLYFKATATYQAISITVLSMGGRGSKIRVWTFEEGNTRANPDIRKYTYTVEGSDAGTANYANSAGSVAWMNVTGKPSTFTPLRNRYKFMVF